MPRCIKPYKSKNNNSTSASTIIPPPPKNNDINQSNQSNGITNTITSNIVSGFAFGAGSSLARNAVDSLFNKNSKTESSNNIKVNEQKIFNDYNECLKNNNEDFCKDFYNSPYKTDN
jgi:hypothetical protein